MMAARQFISCSPVERCLACQADSVGAVNRCSVARLGQDQRVSMGGYPSASQARQRSTGVAPGRFAR
jgi:hypothetical protein